MADLRADCGSCFGLCCVALTFVASADFPVDKPAGDPCVNLSQEHRCGIHAVLPARGYTGCVSYDCLGAGQRVSQVTFEGRDWRTHPSIKASMFAALPIMRQLHELLAYLGDAASRAAAAALVPELTALAQEIEACAGLPAAELVALDPAELRSRAIPLLREASARVRGGGVDHSGADLAGASLAGADLRGALLRGALLIGADLRDARLGRADLIGADLRAADLRGADLSDALYVTQAQLNSARGDARTRVPAALVRPERWR